MSFYGEGECLREISRGLSWDFVVEFFLFWSEFLGRLWIGVVGV